MLENNKLPQFWTKEEDDLLIEAVNELGPRRWKDIAARVPSRTHVQCLQRWNKVLKPGIRKGAWVPEEDALLSELVRKHGGSGNNSDEMSWVIISNQIDGRTPKQCRERWKLNLDPSINHTRWTDEEDYILLKMQHEVGNKWALIARSLPGRTENSVKTRYRSLSRAQTKTWTGEEDSILVHSKKAGMDWEEICSKLSNKTKHSCMIRCRQLLDSTSPLFHLDTKQMVEKNSPPVLITPQQFSKSAFSENTFSNETAIGIQPAQKSNAGFVSSYSSDNNSNLHKHNNKLNATTTTNHPLFGSNFSFNIIQQQQLQQQQPTSPTNALANSGINFGQAHSMMHNFDPRSSSNPPQQQQQQRNGIVLVMVPGSSEQNNGIPMYAMMPMTDVSSSSSASSSTSSTPTHHHHHHFHSQNFDLSTIPLEMKLRGTSIHSGQGPSSFLDESKLKLESSLGGLVTSSFVGNMGHFDSNSIGGGSKRSRDESIASSLQYMRSHTDLMNSNSSNNISSSSSNSSSSSGNKKFFPAPSTNITMTNTSNSMTSSLGKSNDMNSTGPSFNTTDF